MIVDTSAIVALVLQEPGYERIEEALASGVKAGIGTPTLAETGIVLTARLGRDARPLLARLVQEAGLSLVPFGEGHYVEAIRAWQAFGKGRHPAALNFGDCLSYATASLADPRPDPDTDPCPHCEPRHEWPCPTIPRCDEPGCLREATCGWPTLTNPNGGYRRTCWGHSDYAQRRAAEDER